jgi:hypothetical protein
MNTYIKFGLLALGATALTASGVVAANAVYTNTKVGIDKKALGIAAGASIVIAFIMAKALHSK